MTVAQNVLYLHPNAIPLMDFVWNDGVITDWNTAKLGPQPTPEQLAAVAPQVEAAQAKVKLSSLRYQKETGGISIEGQRISSERDEIGHWYPRFADAYAYLQGERSTNPTGQYPYKPKNGDPVIFTAGQAVRAYQCLAWYVNSCFATEATGVYMLSQGMKLDDVLAQLEWPQTEFTWEPPT
jgi:hypothetical protein